MQAWQQSRQGPTHAVDALSWLDHHGYRAQVEQALRKVLMQLWPEAYQAGMAAAGYKISPARLAAAISAFAVKWLAEVVQTRMRDIAEILAQGGSVEDLEAAIKAALESEPNARRIALTELYRAINAALLEAYRAQKVNKVRWVTRSGHPCQICITNEAAGAIPLGQPFPSGDQSPPAHPNCECVLMPAEE